jgi:hypothetical protein
MLNNELHSLNNVMLETPFGNKSLITTKNEAITIILNKGGEAKVRLLIFKVNLVRIGKTLINCAAMSPLSLSYFFFKKSTLLPLSVLLCLAGTEH